MPLKLPDGADARFELVHTGPFGGTFTMHLWGAGRRGWYHAIIREPVLAADTGPLALGKGEWRAFLNLVKQAEFWDLPEGWTHPVPDHVTVDDGDQLDVSGRDRERFHRVGRFVWREPGLDQLWMFCVRRSGFYVQLPGRSGWFLRTPDGASSAPADPPAGSSEILTKPA